MAHEKRRSEMDMQRLILRAALLKLTEGKSVPENVRTCCENISDEILSIYKISKKK